MKRALCSLFAPGVFAVLVLTGCGAKPAATNTTPPANTNAAKPAPAATPPATPAASGASDQLSNLTINNRTQWAVHHLFLSPTKENEWGPDQLGTNTIDPGKSFKLNGIPCDTYDVKVVDEDGDECVIEGEKFCGHEATWDLKDDELLNCEGYGKKE